MQETFLWSVSCTSLSSCEATSSSIATRPGGLVASSAFCQLIPSLATSAAVAADYAVPPCAGIHREQCYRGPYQGLCTHLTAMRRSTSGYHAHALTRVCVDITSAPTRRCSQPSVVTTVGRHAAVGGAPCRTLIRLSPDQHRCAHTRRTLARVLLSSGRLVAATSPPFRTRWSMPPLDSRIIIM